MDTLDRKILILAMASAVVLGALIATSIFMITYLLEAAS